MSKLRLSDFIFVALYLPAACAVISVFSNSHWLLSPAHVGLSATALLCYFSVWAWLFQMISRFGDEPGAWLWHLGVLLMPIAFAPFVYRRFVWLKRQERNALMSAQRNQTI